MIVRTSQSHSSVHGAHNPTLTVLSALQFTLVISLGERIQMCIKSFFFFVNYSPTDIGDKRQKRGDGGNVFTGLPCLIKSVKIN